MELRKLLPLAMAGVVLAASAAGLTGTLRLDHAAGTYARVIGTDLQQERAATELLVDFKTQVQEWKNVLLRGKDPKQLDKYWAGFQKHEKRVHDGAQQLMREVPAGPARDLVSRFAAAHDKMAQGYRAGLDAFRAAGFDAHAGDVAVKGMDREPAELLDQAAAAIAKRATEAAQDADRQRTQALVVSLVLMALAVAAALGVGVAIARSIVRRLGGEPEVAALAARRLAAGELWPEVPRRAGDGHSLMAALHTLRDSLTSIVTQVKTSSSAIAEGTTHIASGNADLGERTGVQAAALQQTAASMDELGSTVRQNAANAQQANELAQNASSVAGRGGDVVAQVVETMRGINDSSRRIADITSVIDGIAFQTNILALNAAVEAARAGEQGRGFAVVAGEVRCLAQRSAEAAREIKTLIGTSVERVEHGSALADQAGATMTEIVSSIQYVAAIMGEISGASGEQATGVSQVGDAVRQMDTATQQNAAMVEQGLAAATSLRDQAQRLVDVVSVFRLQPH